MVTFLALTSVRVDPKLQFELPLEFTARFFAY